MDPRFQIHNSHIEGGERFAELDPQLRRLIRMPLVHRSSLLDILPRGEPGIYALTGGRQTGKSTLVKQWMLELLRSGITPESIRFMTGELIDDHHTLVRLVLDVLREGVSGGPRYLALDEITYVSGWERGVKFLADAGALDDVVLLVTGSDSVLIKDVVATLPGRRGKAARRDFHLAPLTFREAVTLKNVLTREEAGRLMESPGRLESEAAARLAAEFTAYLEHGGFLTGMNDMARDGRISPSTLATYSDWIRGDMLKRGKQEHHLKEVLGSIVAKSCSQVTWNSLGKELSIDHPGTVASYVSLLESMDAVLVQAALLEHRLGPAPKKARRLMFRDPFIFHAVRAWLEQVEDPYREQIRPAVDGAESAARLAEACAVSLYARRYPTFYVKGEKGEVDIAYVHGGRFHPVEVKWSRQVRPADLKQISRYSNGLILDRFGTPREVSGIPTMPLPVALYRLG